MAPMGNAIITGREWANASIACRDLLTPGPRTLNIPALNAAPCRLQLFASPRESCFA